MNDMIDMSRFTEAKSDQLNADDLIGVSRTLTVTKVSGAEGDQPIAIHYEGDNGKPFKPCKTIRRVLLAIWGRYANDYVGRSMTVYRDDSVQFGGLQVGGIRISHMTGIDKETVVVVAKSKGKKAGMKILPLVLEQRVDPATKWARAYISALAELPDAAKLNEFANAKAKKLAELQGANGALHTECVTALDKRRAELAGFTDDEGEGPDVSQTGESHVDYGEFAATVAQLKTMIAAITDADSFDDAKAEYLLHSTDLPKPACDEIEALLAEKRPATREDN